MSGSVTIVEEATEGTPQHPRRGLPPKAGKWPLILGVLLLLVGIAIGIAWPIKVPYYTLSPGPVYDTTDFVDVVDSEAFVDADGELFFLTVAPKEANLFEWLAAQLSPKVDVTPRQNIRPEGVSREDLRRENLARMEQSKTDAQFVALTELGYEPTYIGTGARVIDTIEGTGSNGILLPWDVIVAVDGAVVEFRDDLPGLLEDKEIGDSVVVTVERPIVGTDEETTVPPIGADVEVVDLTIVLGPHVEDPERPMLGVQIENSPPIIEFPIEVKMDSQNIGGPSAGMMFTLEIINQLTEEDITGGTRIAGTGTIRRDGTVGPIGGVKQKVYAAIDAGATVVFVPANNYDNALIAAGDDIIVVRIETIDDPLEYLGFDLVDLAA